MRSKQQRPSSRRRRAGWDRSLGLTVVTGLVLLLVLGLVFSVAYGSRRITVSAATLHDADETLRSATVARAQLGLAVYMAAVDRLFGTNSSEARSLSVSEADVALSDVISGADQLYVDEIVTDQGVALAANRFTEDGYRLISLLEQGNVEQAQELANSDFDAHFQTLSDELVEVRDTLSDGVESSDQLLGRIGNLARFLVAFLIPTAVIVVYRELVRRQQRHADLERRLDTERQLNEAREDFIANASHELRTPLTSIFGLSMVLAETDAVRGEPAAAELLDVIISEADDLSRMVEDLLTVARLDAGAISYSFEDVDATEEIERIADPLQRAGMNLAYSCDVGEVRADRLRFRQVVRNLLSNARKYGGPNVRIDGRVEGSTYLISVVDDGAGIPDEIADRLFERFIHQGHQTASKDSVGLGLSIVHALANGMGGSITYERIEDETHFRLRLPLSSFDQPDAPDRVDADASPYALGGAAAELRPLVGGGIERSTFTNGGLMS